MSEFQMVVSFICKSNTQGNNVIGELPAICDVAVVYAQVFTAHAWLYNVGEAEGLPGLIRVHTYKETWRRSPKHTKVSVF